MKLTLKPSQPLTRLDIGLIIALIALAIAMRIVPGPRTIDDAFITFRYSRNIVEGHGFVYNPDSRVLGTTTPLFTVLMAAFSAISHAEDFPYYAITVSALADAATVVLLFLLARRVTATRWVGLLIGVLWAVAPRSVTFAVGGMETSLVICWMVGTVYCFVTDRPAWMGALAALGLLTRVDSLLWIGPVFAYQVFERYRRREAPPWRTWIAAVIVSAPWFIFSVLYFGSLLSNSLSAKSVAYKLPAGSAAITLIQAYATPFFEFDTFGSRGALIGTFAYGMLAAVGTLFVARRVPRLLPFLLYPWLYALVFGIANPLIFRWYLTPPMPAYFFAIVCGAWALIDALSELRRRRIQRINMQGRIPMTPRSIGRVVALVMLAALWIGMSLNAWTLHPDHGPDRPAPVMAWHKIELDYQKIGIELRDKYGVKADTRVASADIGVIGYFSGATIIDTVGLVTPALSRYYPIDPSLIAQGQNYAIPPQLILDTKPVYFVTMEAFVRLGLVPNATFQNDYTLLDEIPTDFYGTGMRLYGRIGSTSVPERLSF